MNNYNDNTNIWFQGSPEPCNNSNNKARFKEKQKKMKMMKMKW